MKAFDFFKEGLKNFRTVGTVTRSSPFLCRKVVEAVDFERANVLVELGAGDGVITRHLLEGMKADARLLAFEVLPGMCELLEKIEDPRLLIVQDSAENLPQHLEAHHLPRPDVIVSAIPFLTLPRELMYGILQTCHRLLPEKGRFVQVHYSRGLKKHYERIFGNVRIDFVPLNVPPAFVLIMEKSGPAESSAR